MLLPFLLGVAIEVNIVSNLNPDYDYQVKRTLIARILYVYTEGLVCTKALLLIILLGPASNFKAAVVRVILW